MTEPLTKEKLDELEGLLRERDAATKEHRSCRAQWAFYANKPDNNSGRLICNSRYTSAIRRLRIVTRKAEKATADNFPALLSAAREVETLRAQLRDVTAERDALKIWLSTAGRSEQVTRNQRDGYWAEVQNLTTQLADRDAALTTARAEVERLEGRDAFARPFVERNNVDEDGDETCPVCTNYVRFTSGSEHACSDDCARSAWLAGCKS